MDSIPEWATKTVEPEYRHWIENIQVRTKVEKGDIQSLETALTEYKQKILSCIRQEYEKHLIYDLHESMEKTINCFYDKHEW